jgi:hypothetical protein
VSLLRAAAVTLVPFWDTTLGGRSPQDRDKARSIFGSALRASTRDTVTGFVRKQGDAGDRAGDARAAGRGETAPGPCPWRVGFGDLAADCAARLRARITRPLRASGDWSVELPPGNCDCELCRTLRGFLEDKDRRTFEWPLAKERRQHVHARIDATELPVTHVTRRQSSPYVLVLHKTEALSPVSLRRATETKRIWTGSRHT